MVEIEKIFINNNTIKLEAEYFQSSLHNTKPSILICHPHPQFGGNMYNNVVSGVFKKLIERNISCLRFNFRGVGKSNGNHSNGKGELSDVKAAIDFLINHKKCKKIIICGYSYGAAIGCSTVNYSDNVISFIAISFPFEFMGSNYKKLSQTSKTKLFIQGDRDNIAYYEKFYENFNFYLDPKICKIINGADHFYWGYEEQVANTVLNFYYTFD
ncbi:MAG: alpha/beta hydrolase [Promethearchaeota archaeon]